MLIECVLLPINEYSFEDDGKKRYGRYHGSDFWDVPEYGSKRWVVGAYIKANLNDLLEQGYTHDEIVDGCVSYLNLPPKRKKYAKKDPKPKYGTLQKYKAKIVEKDGEKLVSALLITDMKKSKHFWGKGKNV
tara:strand:- start:12664 stop:13059 length:396 start_codon:yes stop_codon:yes gene_type:complete